jgi:MarR family transcriptional regulator, temperature-dependent positive regulator of motility
MHVDAAGPCPAGEPLRPLTFQSSTWYLLSQAGAQARHLWAEVLAQMHVSPSQYKVLRALSEFGPLGQHQLAGLIGVDPRNAVPLLDSLADRGLLDREVDGADRRRRVLTLTASGQKFAAELASIAAEIENEFLSPLTGSEQESLRRMLLSLLRSPEQ